MPDTTPTRRTRAPKREPQLTWIDADGNRHPLIAGVHGSMALAPRAGLIDRTLTMTYGAASTLWEIAVGTARFLRGVTAYVMLIAYPAAAVLCVLLMRHSYDYAWLPAFAATFAFAFGAQVAAAVAALRKPRGFRHQAFAATSSVFSMLAQIDMLAVLVFTWLTAPESTDPKRAAVMCVALAAGLAIDARNAYRSRASILWRGDEAPTR